jgi:hypothetical protein
MNAAVDGIDDTCLFRQRFVTKLKVPAVRPVVKIAALTTTEWMLLLASSAIHSTLIHPCGHVS